MALSAARPAAAAALAVLVVCLAALRPAHAAHIYTGRPREGDRAESAPFTRSFVVGVWYLRLRRLAGACLDRPPSSQLRETDAHPAPTALTPQAPAPSSTPC